MSIHQDDDTLGKAYDSRLMRRLLSYARPYRAWFALAIVILVAIAGADLARPYVIKVAIDDYITGYDAPMARFLPQEVPPQVTAGQRMDYGGYTYVRAKHLPQSYRGEARYQLLHTSGKYVIISGVLPKDHEGMEIIERESGTLLRVDGSEYAAEILDHQGIYAFRAHDITAVANLAWFLLGVGLLSFVLSYWQAVMLQRVGQTTVYTIREQLFTHLQRMDLSFFDRNPVGRLVTRITNDTETLNEMYTSVVVSLFKDIFTLIGIVLIMFRLNTELALVSLATLPLIVISTVIFRSKARDAYRRVRSTLAKINAVLAENISGMRIVQIFNREHKKYTEFESTNTEYYKAGLGEMMVYAVFRPLMEMIGTLALTLVVWYGGMRVMRGTIQFGVVFAFINYVGQFFAPINDLTEKYNILQSAMASSEKVFHLLDTPITVTDPENPVEVGVIRGEIEFRNVWFAYNNEDWVLRDVSFTIKPGEMVAFVGATGAGKTSIISLMNRFYDIQKGQILLDGVDIRRYRTDDLRRSIATVLQDVFLFTGDIKTNIRLNNADISDARIREVARYVNADYFISKLPNGYDEPVTERGSTLSAGQRQLLAFARALAFEPAVLVLDEATANIDTETELLIQDALPKLIEGRTTIVVAHRLSTIQHADNIIVLHKGRIREMGTHQELLARKGIYYDLYRLQYKDSSVIRASDRPSGDDEPGGFHLDHADRFA